MDKTNSYFLFFVICIVMLYDCSCAGKLNTKKVKTFEKVEVMEKLSEKISKKIENLEKMVRKLENFAMPKIIKNPEMVEINTIEKSKFLQLPISSNSTNSNYSYATLDKCDNTTCNSDVGYCLNNNMCICKEDFANFPINNTFYPDSACNYEKRKQVIAFLLEFLIPFGSSYFYLGRVNVGLLKVSVLFFMPLIVLFLSCHCCKTTSPISNKANKIICNTVALVFFIGIVVWLFWDLINIALGKYTDSNGVSLSTYTWNLS